MKSIESLHFITHITDDTSLTMQLEAVIQGGVRWIQFRQKHLSDASFLLEAKEASKICRQHDVKLIINDRASVAKKINADGVHLGKQDMSPVAARRLLGENKIIGCTANTLTDVIALSDAPIDYIGLGPLRFTYTKERLSPILGFAGYTRIMQELIKRGIQIPIIAIGGIELADIPLLLNTGIHGIALSNAILGSRDIRATAKLFLDSISSFITKQQSISL